MQWIAFGTFVVGLLVLLLSALARIPKNPTP
jgi:hypothetical protein